MCVAVCRLAQSSKPRERDVSAMGVLLTGSLDPPPMLPPRAAHQAPFRWAADVANDRAPAPERMFVKGGRNIDGKYPPK